MPTFFKAIHDAPARRFERKLARRLLALWRKERGMITPEGVIVQTYAAGFIERQAAVVLPWLAEVMAAGLEAGAAQVGAKRKGQKAEPIETGLEINWELVNQQAADWAEQYGYELIREITETTMAQTQAAINQWIAAGETMPDLIKRVQAIYDNPARARLIATTEATRAYAEANTIAWRDIGAWGREWRTAQDEIVCKICGPLAGTRAEMGGTFAGIANPPAHPNCRCSLVPVVLPEVAAVEPYTPPPAAPVTQTDRGYDAGPVTVDKPIIPPGFSIPAEGQL